MAKKRNPQDAYQIQIRALKKRCTSLEGVTKSLQADIDLLVDRYNQLCNRLHVKAAKAARRK